MELIQTRSDEDPRSIASNVEIADSTLSHAIGLMFRRDLPDDYAFVMDFKKPKRRIVHTFFVYEPIDVVWLIDGKVQHVKRMTPFTSLGMGKADQIIEIPAGPGIGIYPGDDLTVSDAD